MCPVCQQPAILIGNCFWHPNHACAGGGNNVTKPAKVEGGMEVGVPLFINPGDEIEVDTRTGKYLNRA